MSIRALEMLQDTTRHGTAGHDTIRYDTTAYEMTRLSTTVHNDMATTRCIAVRYNKARSGTARHDTNCIVPRYNLIRYCLPWYVNDTITS